MYKKAKYITTVPGENKKTAYVLCKNPNILLPIEVRDGERYAYPNIPTLLSHILNVLSAEIVMIKIFKYCSDLLYTYLTLKVGKRLVEINVAPDTAVKISALFKIPIYVNEKVVKDLGLRVTREMILKALESSPEDNSGI